MRLTICLAALIAAGAAHADNLDEAKAAFADGKSAFERGDYAGAIAKFERANQLAPAPTLHYNIGRAHEKLGHYKEAVASFDQFLATAGEPKDEEDRKFREDLRRRVEDLRRQANPPPNAPPPPPPTYYNQPPPPSYYQYQPQPYYNPYGGYQMAPMDQRAIRLANAKRKKEGGIKAIAAGSVLLGLGAIFIGATSPLTNKFTDFSGEPEIYGALLLALGVPMAITGLIVLPIGIGNTVSGSNEYNRIMKEPTIGPAVPGQPRAFLFPAFTYTF
jgi:tetratricopeptide (TPR) repeat protein